MAAIIDWLFDLLKTALNWVVNLLPDSPFTALSNSPIAPYLGMINWIVPLNFIVTTLTAWLTAVSVYYVYSVLLRWVKAVE